MRQESTSIKAELAKLEGGQKLEIGVGNARLPNLYETLYVHLRLTYSFLFRSSILLLLLPAEVLGQTQLLFSFRRQPTLPPSEGSNSIQLVYCSVYVHESGARTAGEHQVRYSGFSEFTGHNFQTKTTPYFSGCLSTSLTSEF